MVTAETQTEQVLVFFLSVVRDFLRRLRSSFCSFSAEQVEDVMSTSPTIAQGVAGMMASDVPHQMKAFVKERLAALGLSQSWHDGTQSGLPLCPSFSSMRRQQNRC